MVTPETQKMHWELEAHHRGAAQKMRPVIMWANTVGKRSVFP